MPADGALVESVSRRLGIPGAAAERLAGGSRNRCYRLRQGALDVVLRIAGSDDDAYAVARVCEWQAQRLAAVHGLAPGLLLADPAAGVSVTHYLPGPVWSRDFAASAAGAARAGAWLGHLHSVAPTSGLRQVDFRATLEAYCRRAGVVEAEAAMLRQAGACAERLAATATPAFCHNDLHHMNLIDSDHGLMAIDWEYAGVGHPWLDIAGYQAYHDLDAAALAALLDAYRDGAGEPRPADLADARWLFEAVWWAWLELRRRLEGREEEDMRAMRRKLAQRIERPVP